MIQVFKNLPKLTIFRNFECDFLNNFQTLFLSVNWIEMKYCVKMCTKTVVSNSSSVMVLPCRFGCAVVNWWLPLVHMLGMFSENQPLILFLGELQRLSTIIMPGWQKCGLMSGKSSILASIQVLFNIQSLHAKPASETPKNYSQH